MVTRMEALDGNTSIDCMSVTGSIARDEVPRVSIGKALEFHRWMHIDGVVTGVSGRPRCRVLDALSRASLSIIE